jgi:butyryl-CoA dehydrogenase
MEFLLTEEQIMLKDMVAKFAKEKIAPVAADNEKNHRFPADIIKKQASLG